MIDPILPLFIRYSNLWFVTGMPSACPHLMADEDCYTCARRSWRAARKFDRWRKRGRWEGRAFAVWGKAA